MSNPDPVTDLCERAKSGDLEAASALVDHFYERLYAWFRRLTGDEQEAADLTQKTFCKVWASLHSYEHRSSFSSWLHGIGHHVFLDWLRQRRPMQTASDEWWQQQPDENPHPGQLAADRDRAGWIYQLVDAMEPEVKQTMHLHYYQGLSIAETAEVLQVATSTVKYRVRTALDLLKTRTKEPILPTH